MRVLFILIIGLNINNWLFAQQTFEQLISTEEDQIINHVAEDDSGNFILVGRIHNVGTNYPGGYVIKIDNFGNILNECVIQPSDTNSYILFNVHYHNNNIYLLGLSSDTLLNTKKYLWYTKMNDNLEILNQSELSIPSGHWFSYFNSIIDSDTNFVIAGYVTRESDDIEHYHNEPAFYKVSLVGDSLSSNFMLRTVHGSRFGFDIIENNDSTGYHAFVSRFETPEYGSGQKLILDRNLDSINIHTIPLGIMDNYSPINLSDTSILICGKGTPQSELYALNVISLNEQTEQIDYNSFKIEGNMRDHPAMYNGVSKNGDNIYVGGTSNFSYSNPFWSTNDSWFHLIKINPNISPIWEYWYGGDAYYHLYSILATNDGGCLMVGNRYDYETQYQERDIYIAKVNSEGLIVWTQEIPIDKQLTTVYPNPGTNQLNIKMDNEELDFELINLNGQVVIKQIVNNNLKTINTVLLKSGIYFYRLIDKKNKTIETGKWMKK